MSIIPETAAERRRRLLEQRGSTYLDHVEEQPPGWFNKIEPQTGIGRTTPHPYPAAAQWVQTELPPEPPLGLENPCLESPPVLSASSSDTDPGPASAGAPSNVVPPLRDEQRADAGSSFDDGGFDNSA